MSMQAKDWLTLPPRIDRIENVVFSEQEREQYDTFERNSYLQFLEQEITANTATALTNKLLQYCNGAVYTQDGSSVKTNSKKLE